MNDEETNDRREEISFQEPTGIKVILFVSKEGKTSFMKGKVDVLQAAFIVKGLFEFPECLNLRLIDVRIPIAAGPAFTDIKLYAVENEAMKVFRIRYDAVCSENMEAKFFITII